jgi:hypothetical protein
MTVRPRLYAGLAASGSARRKPQPPYPAAAAARRRRREGLPGIIARRTFVTSRETGLTSDFAVGSKEEHGELMGCHMIVVCGSCRV